MYLALRSVTFFLYAIAQCRSVRFIRLLGITYVVNKGTRLQTRRPRQFLGTGHMVFSQPLTRKTLRNFLHTFYLFFSFCVTRCAVLFKNKLSFSPIQHNSLSPPFTSFVASFLHRYLTSCGAQISTFLLNFLLHFRTSDDQCSHIDCSKSKHNLRFLHKSFIKLPGLLSGSPGALISLMLLAFTPGFNALGQRWPTSQMLRATFLFVFGRAISNTTDNDRINLTIPLTDIHVFAQLD